ncbi:MFS transporter [Prosthecomicrobium hirschii]|nr:MFS transporter [Prosthecomicrobium hirschii]
MTRSTSVPGQSPAQSRELSLARLIAFALPALPVAAFQLPFVIIVPNFYAETLGLSLATVGILNFAVRAIDAILDPFIGYGADHIRPRWGRRRTWFAVAAVPMTLGALMVFNPFPAIDVSNTWFWAGWFFLWSAMLSVGYTALSLSHQSWAAELSPSYYGRNRMFAAREVMIVVGTLIATGLPFVLSKLGYHGDRPVLVALSILVGVATPLFVFLTVTTVPEPREATNHPLNFIGGLKGMAANKPFRRLLGAFALSYMANGMAAALLIYFVRDYVRGDEQTQRLFLLLYFLFGVLSTPLWLWVARRTSKHRAWCIAMMVACAVIVFSPFVGHHQIGDASIWAFGIIVSIAGSAVGADLMLPPSMQADVIDVDTARSGEQHTGFYFAIWALATKLALAVALGLSLVVLGYFAGFKVDRHDRIDTQTQLHQIQTVGAPEAPTTLPRVPADPNATPAQNHKVARKAAPIEQTPFALWTLAILYAWVPVALKMLSVLLIWNFPIGANEQARLREEIEAHMRERQSGTTG